MLYLLALQGVAKLVIILGITPNFVPCSAQKYFAYFSVLLLHNAKDV